MNEFETMTTIELERAIGAATRQLDGLAAQLQGIRRAMQNGRGNDALQQQQVQVEAQVKALRGQKQKLQQALTQKRHPAPGVAPVVERETFDYTAGPRIAREREQARGR